MTINIIAKFSATIKYLKLKWIQITLTDFLEILSLVPNAEHFEIFSLKLIAQNIMSATQKICVMPINIDLNLHKLRTLEFVFCGEDVFDVFNRLPTGILTEISIYFNAPHLNALTALFQRQKAIKKLSIRSSHSYDYENDHVGLDSINNQYNTGIAKMLSNHTKLKSFSIRGVTVHECLINVVTSQFADLDTLTTDISNLPASAIRSISKLDKLKDLSLKSDGVINEVEFETFTKLDNKRIINLYICHHNHLPSYHLLSALAKSAPNLKVLHLGCFYNCQTLIDIMRNFNSVEILKFHSFYHSDCAKDLDYVDKGDCFNPKLIELRISRGFPYDTSFLSKLINYFPNLRTLEMKSVYPLSSSDRELILDGFTKLESLSCKSIFGSNGVYIAW